MANGDVISWHDFTQETSMHGIRYVKMQKISLVRRVLWSVFIGGCLTYFMIATYLFLRDYDKKLLNTKIKVKNASKLKFPTVTICNQNYWMKKYTTSADIPEAQASMFREILSDLYLGYVPSPPPDGKYNWSDPYLMSIVNMSRNGMDEMLRSSAHPMNETFFACLVKGQSTPCDTVLNQIRTDAGYCFQFNENGTFESNSAGRTGGISFMLDAITSEYYIGPFSYSEGFSVLLHDHTTVPLMAELGYGIPTGTEMIMNIQKTETIREPPPADDNQSDCFDTMTRENPLHFFDSYTYQGCFQECKAAFVINLCSCRDLLQPPLNNTRTCDMYEMLYCSTPALRQFHAHSSHLDACNCKSECREIQYSAKVSALTFPSVGYARSTLNATPEEIDYMKKNYVALTIYYGQMSYERLEEKVAFTPYDLIANLGGTLGVCIGGSLLTLFEFAEFGIISLTNLLAKRQSKLKSLVKPFSGNDLYPSKNTF
ncbi:acid-sensing ion channel 2-like [Watersipora subatra]|uniref:acid-sensing ion channel 2-like n=1 Tax=Watersipora subatra TaxID=2589382 RepID=UPI00355C6D5F